MSGEEENPGWYVSRQEQRQIINDATSAVAERLRAENERLRGLLREAWAYIPHTGRSLDGECTESCARCELAKELER